MPASQFETVFLINGTFSKSGAAKLFDKNVVYLTVLPLSALLLSYTVKIVGRTVASNREFCSVYSLDDETDIAVLRPRNILSATPQRSQTDLTPVKFFETIKAGRTAAARLLMSEELKNSVDDESLVAFFEEFSDIVPASKVESGSDKFILCRKDGTASFYDFSYRQGLIDDITQVK